LSWNRSVSHILASASDNGKVVVWDLKANKSIFNFSMPTEISGGSDYDFDYYGGSGMDQQY
jgi:WD40 repeat protein